MSHPVQHNRISRRDFLRMVGISASATLLATCAPKRTPQPTPEPAAPKPTVPEPTPAPAVEEQVSLRLWTHMNAAFNAGYEALIAAYKDVNPNVDITLETFEYGLYIQTLQTAMPAGEEADILQLFGTWTSEYAERLAPVPADVMTLSEAEDLFYAAPIGGFTIEGRLYGLPQEFNCEYGGVLVNKTMFENAGVTYPPQWKSREDVLANAQKLVQRDETDTMTVAGFHFTSSDPLAFDFLAGIKQRGGEYWKPDRTGFTFNTPEAKETVQMMLSAVKDWGVVDPVLFEDAVNWVGSAFFEGRVAIGYIGSWAIAMGKIDYPDFQYEWDYFFLPPHVEGKDPLFVADTGWGLVVSPRTKHPDVAWDFGRFVTAVPENATAWNIASGTIPAIPEVAESPQIAEAMPFVAKALQILPYGEYLGSMPDRDLIIYEIIYPHILGVLQGVETVDDALAVIDEEANATFG